jgi:hypothetical protein|uniref:Uncharacterized protein n=1 Tax=Picea glauca TaxID=3330 RepID=A0A101M3E0_PICGL|nr:hypothetical protein ABT39_MTgene187 [Picea glauca]
MKESGDEVKHKEERHANAKLASGKPRLSLTYGWMLVDRWKMERGGVGLGTD